MEGKENFPVFLYFLVKFGMFPKCFFFGFQAREMEKRKEGRPGDLGRPGELNSPIRKSREG